MAGKVRVADYIARTLVSKGVRHAFIVTGGGAMHLNDAIGRAEGLDYVCCHHEQACAMAAQGYYRLTNELALVNVTAGPGGTNAVTGVFGAWVDSLGMIVVSGQVKWETLVASTGLPLRQLGDQEVDIVRMVAGITKYAHMVTDPSTIRLHLEKAIHLARTGRPGPCWIDVPMNVQSAMVDPDQMEPYRPPETTSLAPSPADIATLLDRMVIAQRPIIYAGPGIRLAGAAESFRRLLDRWQVPVVTSFNAHDLVPSDHPLFAGRPGTIGDRAGNFSVQNADLVLVLGARLNIRQLSYAWEHFARNAFKVMVDVDEAELRKPTVRPDLPIHADAGALIDALLRSTSGPEPARIREWVQWCQERRRRYPVVLPEYYQPSRVVNPYRFGKALFEALADDDVIVTGDATACITTFQTADLRPRQRLFSDSGCAPMGFDLPAAIGACVGNGMRRVICLAGDGSIMLNLQELQTIAGYRLPVKIFIYNNQGYVSIRQTQQNFFPDNPVGCDPASGVTFPDFERIAHGFSIPFQRCRDHSEMATAIQATLGAEGPQICEVMMDPVQAFSPKTSSRRLPDGRMVTAPLEDMAPFLPRDEFRENMLIEPVATEPD